MRLTELLNTENVTISCELFPPKQGAQLDNYKKIVGDMAALKTAYMSVTYGATGGTSDYTVELANEVRNVNHIPALAHLTCASSTKEKVASVIQELKEKQIENVLALRGDIPQNADFPLPNQYKHASELIYDIKSQGDFCIGGACYPEGHPESQTLEEDQDYQKYLPETDYQAKQDGFIQPYADSPLDDEHVGESVYMNLIAHAKKEIYFTTPYLIITDEMNRALGLAAKRGVDVRIVTPGIPDKKLIYKVTRSYYAGLVRQGVRIYEYTPGFIHAKQCVCDGEAATCGTINMDYRSLYLHFENGAFLYNCDAVKEMRKDFEHIFAESTEVTEKYKSGRSAVLRGTQCLLRLFAPLM